MKIMSDEDAVDSVDTEDTEENIFIPSRRRVHRSINIINSSQDSQHSIRRSTRNKLQTYDNLNTSWIFGTQTLKGYPMYKQQCSSSDREMVDEHPPRERRSRRRMSLRSRDAAGSRSISNNRESRARQYRLRDRSDVDQDHEQDIGRGGRGRPRNNRSLREHSDCNRSLRSERDKRISEPTERELRSRHQNKEINHLEDKSDLDVDLKTAKDNQIKANIKAEPKNNTVNVKAESNDKVLRSSKADSPVKPRDGPVTRQRHSYTGITKNSKKTTEEDKDEDQEEETEEEEEEEEMEEDNENSQESEKTGKNKEGFGDMYSRVKHTRRVSQRMIQKRQIAAGDSDLSESSDTPGPRKYSLRQKKPTVDRLQIRNEPVRRSIRERTFRSVYTTAVRRRKHRSKSSTSSDSSDSEAQCYDKKKNKKSRQSSIPQGGPSDRKADISPISVDGNLTFNDVGGLESHIHCLKEMVVFPMIYPEVFDRFHITPPKGVLFHGPPGTGKTLIARALANECSKDNRKVSFFMRKGADCLTKWVGESERQLRLLFEQAQQMKPSIIFFDELDGLAPVRSTKQDQIHASIVSTLLALMDGLDDRGEVIVIGATNRIDAIDPALRRPGRFDRELFFPLPAMKERLEILKIHVKKWANPPDEDLLEILADKSTGYCGSDLKALCTEAVIQGLKRTYPQIYLTNNRLLLNPTKVEVKKDDFEKASSLLVPASHRVTPCIGKRLSPFIQPLLEPSLNELLSITRKMFPQGTNPALAKLKVTKGVHRPRLLITGGTVAQNQGPKLAKALIYNMEHVPVHTLNVSTLFAESARSPEETCVQVFNEASRNIPSIIYITAVDQWWPLVPETVKAVFLCRITSLDTSLPIFILATSEVTYDELPRQLQELFSNLRGEVFSIKPTTREQRAMFFKPIFTVQSLKPPSTKEKTEEKLEELPLAPTPEPKKLTPEEQKMLFDKEEVSLRELRIFLREICAKLARNKQFFMFTKPVDTEEVPDYNDIIKQPMDLETMMTKIDLHSYLCARDFLEDIDLIRTNALEYNPDRNPADKLIRHRACSLRDNAYALIKAELDSDFEDKCRDISKSRRSSREKKKDGSKKENGAAVPIIMDSPHAVSDKNDTNVPAVAINGRVLSSSMSRKRRVKSSWSRGLVRKLHKKKKISFEDTDNASTKPAAQGDGEGIDLEKFQEFENEMHAGINGHVFENSAESDNDNDNEYDRESQYETDMDKKAQAQTENCVEMPSVNNDDKHSPGKNSNSVIFMADDNVDDISFALDSDSSLSAFTIEERERVLINRQELDDCYEYTNNATADFPIELLCDIYVQLNRRVAQYCRTHDRKALPKDLLEDFKSFEKCNNLEKEKIAEI